MPDPKPSMLRPVSIEDRMVVSRSGETDARRFGEAAINLEQWGSLLSEALRAGPVQAAAMKDSVKVIAVDRPSVLSGTGPHEPAVL